MLPETLHAYAIVYRYNQEETMSLTLSALLDRNRRLRRDRSAARGRHGLSEAARRFGGVRERAEAAERRRALAQRGG